MAGSTWRRSKSSATSCATNILCMGGRTVGPAVAWDLVQTYLEAKFSQAERHMRRLDKVAAVENQGASEAKSA